MKKNRRVKYLIQNVKLLIVIHNLLESVRIRNTSLFNLFLDKNNFRFHGWPWKRPVKD